MKSFIKSVRHASSGLKYFFYTERHAIIDAIIAVIAILLAGIFSISLTKWAVILLCIALVFSLEILNSSIEKLADYLETKTDIQIKYIKDLAAGAVLFSAFISLVIGCIIFIPEFIVLLK